MEDKDLLIKIANLYNKTRKATCEKAKEIYHYTSASVAMQIIENNKLRFRFCCNNNTLWKYDKFTFDRFVG